jgi:hypothetical protein
MLIVVAPSIAEAIGDALAALREVVEDLARAHRRADHLVVAAVWKDMLLRTIELLGWSDRPAHKSHAPGSR